jgi:type II secretory pathway pseudopilin PulG
VILWVAIGVTLAALLAIAALPIAIGAHQQRAIQRTAEILEQVRLATYDVAATNKAFRQRVGSNPGRLSQLVYPISSNNAANFPDSCNTQYTNAQATNWTNWGPFLGFQLDASLGLPTPIGTADNTMIRNPALGGAGVLIVRFPNVDEADAIMLDQFADTATGIAAGAIQWTAPAGGVTTLDFRIIIDAAC